MPEALIRRQDRTRKAVLLKIPPAPGAASAPRLRSRSARRHVGSSSRPHSAVSRVHLLPDPMRRSRDSEHSKELPLAPRGPPTPAPVAYHIHDGSPQRLELDSPFSLRSSDSSEIERQTDVRRRAGTPDWARGSSRMLHGQDRTAVRPCRRSPGRNRPEDGEEGEEEEGTDDEELPQPGDILLPTGDAGGTSAEDGPSPPSWSSSWGSGQAERAGLGFARQTKD